MSTQAGEAPETPGREDLEYLWSEYQYRHQLCWNAMYKLTAAVVALGVLPYANTELTALLGRAMLVPPAIGTLLALFGVFVVNNELRLFAYAKVAHNYLHKKLLQRLITDENVLVAATDRLSLACARFTLFDIYAHVLVVVLFIISAGHAGFLYCCWPWK